MNVIFFVSQEKKMLFYDIEMKSLPKIVYACTVGTERYRTAVEADTRRLELCEVLSGEYIFASDTAWTVCEKGNIYPICKDASGQIYTEGKTPVKLICVCAELDYELRTLDSAALGEDGIKALMKEQLSSDRILMPCGGLSTAELDWISSYMKKIASCSTGERIGEGMRALSLWLEMMSRISKACMSLIACDCRAFSTSAIAYSEMAVSYIVKHYRDKITVSDIADGLGLSPNYLHAIFKQVKGTTIIDYLTAYRMDIAKIYIERFGLYAYEAAALVGIDDPAYFSRVFKKLYGKSINDHKKNVL